MGELFIFLNNPPMKKIAHHFSTTIFNMRLKRKCQKGLQHQERYIQAVCLQAACSHDRLLCFYCILESHQSHSVAYLVGGLQSPLEMLNKNSQVSHPEKHMKYIEKRFKRMNNAWLRISDNLQNGLSRIEQKMLPQFNVIRETFKKNSVQKIISQLTSSTISPQKIEQYVQMINMVKKYKFNDIKKIKIMSYIMQHKFSRIFSNANTKIKSIMDNVIKQTDQMNFITFDAEKLQKDRQLYLQLSGNLKMHKIKDFQVNTETWNANKQKQKLQSQQSGIYIVDNDNMIEIQDQEDSNQHSYQQNQEHKDQMGFDQQKEHEYYQENEQNQQYQKTKQRNNRFNQNRDQTDSYHQPSEKSQIQASLPIISENEQEKDEQYMEHSNGFRSLLTKKKSNNQVKQAEQVGYICFNDINENVVLHEQNSYYQNEIIQISSSHRIQTQQEVKQQVQNQQNSQNHKKIQLQNEQICEVQRQSLQQSSMILQQVEEIQNISSYSAQDDIRPSFSFQLMITKQQNFLKSNIDLRNNSYFVEDNTRITQNQDQHNQFYQFYGQNNQEQDKAKIKQLENLKKYYIFAKQSDSQSSSQQLIQIHPKRKQWIVENLHYQKSQEIQECVRKRLKPNQMISSAVQTPNTRQKAHLLQQNKLIQIIDQNLKVNESNGNKNIYSLSGYKRSQMFKNAKSNKMLKAQSNSYHNQISQDLMDDNQHLRQAYFGDQIHKQNINIDNNQQNKLLQKPYVSMKLNKQGLAEVSNQLLKKYEQKMIRKDKNKPKDQQKIKIRSVQVYGRYQQQIRKRLDLIDQDYVQQLTITCDTKQCAINEQSVGLICKMKKLTVFRLYWAYHLAKPLVRKLINNLKQLTELVLCQFHQVDTELASEIVNKLPNLRRFHFASDYMRHLAQMEENVQFFIDITGSKTKLAPLYTLSKLKDLETLWISDVDDLKEVRQIIVQMKNLKQVSISAFEKKNKDLNSIFLALSKKRTLISLSLQCLQFKQQLLVSIIRSNPCLNTLIINECPIVSNQTINAVVQSCPRLEQLFLMLTDSVGGQRICELRKLKTLIIRACWSINVPSLKNGLKNLQELKSLSLNMNNYWLNDEMLHSIALLPNLRTLNIDTTGVTDKGIQVLTGLKNLNTLICGRTQITAAGFYKFLQKSQSNIRKLGLSRQSNEQLLRPKRLNKHDVFYTQFQGKYLVRIGQLLPQLTHLSIGGFKNLYIENFATLDNLKCLEYKVDSLSEQTKLFLENVNLNLNANV